MKTALGICLLAGLPLLARAQESSAAGVVGIDQLADIGLLRFAHDRALLGNIRRLALGIHLHEKKFLECPTAATWDKNGRPLLSWRVSVLPFVGQKELYREFHLDEPWDSDHNNKLIAKMPAVFAVPGVTKPGNTVTHYRVFHSGGAVFGLKKGTRLGNLYDDASNTLLIIEATNPVTWSKPDDFEFGPDKPLPKFGKLRPGQCMAVCADGYAVFIKSKARELMMRRFIQGDDGQVFDYRELQP
ncbi:MAG: DUF1559 domain-containing protein [Gemmataceae bacterium]